MYIDFDDVHCLIRQIGGALSNLLGKTSQTIELIHRNEFMDLTAWLVCLGAVILCGFDLYFVQLSCEL